MRKIVFFVLLLLATTLYSCGKKSDPNCVQTDSLFHHFKNTVVLIQHSYIYKVQVGSDITVYCTKSNKDTGIDIINDLDEAKKKKQTIYGTGFFIGREGEIITNRHVAYPWNPEDDKIIKGKIIESINNNESKIEAQKDELDELLSILERKYSHDDMDRYDYQNTKRRLLAQKKAINSNLSSVKSIAKANIKIDVQTISIGIALHDTHINEEDDFIECITRKISDNADIDLAMIQTKSRSVPGKVKNVFTLTKIEKEPIKINTKVFMFGYNYGASIARTSEGLKVQFTQGNITQETDGRKVLYSIPSLPGSSGGPVINECGDIVAINFAGLAETQSFNYGIISKHLLEFLK